MKKNYRNKINNEITEMLSKQSEINNEIKNLEFKKKDSLIIMLIINFFIALVFSVGMIGLITSASVEISKALSIVIPMFLTTSGINTIYRVRKIKKCNNKLESCIEQNKYLDKEIEKLDQLKKKPKIKIDTISNIKNWKKKFALMKDYAKYKKMFVKNYKKGTLASSLKNSYYTVSEMKYLFDKTEEDCLEKQSKKILNR